MERVGTESIRGRETDHFEGTIDVDTFPETLGATAPDAFGDGTPGDVDLRFGVWPDAEDVQRLELRLTRARPTSVRRPWS